MSAKPSAAFVTAVLTVAGLGWMVTPSTAQGPDGAVEPPPPEALPQEAFLTGVAVEEAEVDGLRCKVQPDADGYYKLSVINESAVDRRLEVSVETYERRGSMVSRMGPTTRQVNVELVRLQVPAGGTATHRLAYRDPPEVLAARAAADAPVSPAQAGNARPQARAARARPQAQAGRASNAGRAGNGVPQAQIVDLAQLSFRTVDFVLRHRGQTGEDESPPVLARLRLPETVAVR